MIKEFSGKHRWLSNFWLSPVVMDGAVYPAVENAYQAAKFSDEVMRAPFIFYSPGKAKKTGSDAPLTEGWEFKKIEVMHKLLDQKFREGSFLADKLIETGSQEIIEGNTWHDAFWGVCDGAGDNHLGVLIMRIRDRLAC